MRAAIFDLDGTLADTLPGITEATRRLLEDEGLAPLPADVLRGFVGLGERVFLGHVMAARGLPSDPDSVARLREAFMVHYVACGGHGALYPGVLAALDALAGSGWALGLCTNKPEAAARPVLAATGLAGRFGAEVFGDTLPERKPSPAPLALARGRLGAHRAVYVGDSEVDAATARAAGLPFALFLGGYHKDPEQGLAPDLAFADWNAVPALLDALLAG